MRTGISFHSKNGGLHKRRKRFSFSVPFPKIMPRFDRYLLGQLVIAGIFVSVVLVCIIFLTQSLRFLELVIGSGAMGAAFWTLTFLALPRFFEIILPISLMASVLFVYHRMTMDSEIVIMRAGGASPMTLARPALLLAAVLTVFLWLMTTWLAPVALSKMQRLQEIVRAQYSAVLFREGVFNQVGDDITVYVRDRLDNGELRGLLIYDKRDVNPWPVMITAQRGALVNAQDGQKVLVYDGSRQEFNRERQTLTRLDFERYTVELPESGPIRQRWREPDERTLFELLNPDPNVQRDLENTQEFITEAHRRIISPLLAPALTMIALVCLLLGPIDRRGQGRRILAGVVGAVLIESLYLSAFNLSRNHYAGLVFMYALVFMPIAGGLFMLGGRSEKIRRKLLYIRWFGLPSIGKGRHV